MSLIPYHSREGREIVLRHHNSIVVRDRDSQRLEIRRTECPTCHQPLGCASSPERPLDRQYDMSHEYVNPDYFRMLRAGNEASATPDVPPSPISRIFAPALANTSSVGPSPSAVALNEEAEFISSTPGVAQVEGSRIRRNAFQPNYFNDFFVEETVLGRGGKGVVLLVRHEIDGYQLGHFACKRVPVGDDHSWLERVLIEVELLAKLSHPNLVSYRHVWLENVQLTRFGPSVACAFILQQYCNGGDLHQYILGSAPREATKEELKARMRRRSKGQTESPNNFLEAQPQLPFEDIYSFFKDITSGVAYLHAANYIHRDLKPSNCLLHREGGALQCLISDFGEVQAENVVRKSTGSTGTISYCAPEVLKMDVDGRYGNFTTKSDMFSLGMILYFMCFGRLPYQGANTIQEELEDIEVLRAEIVDWKGFQDERRERTDLPTRLYKLLQKLLALNPAERPSANEVLIAMKSETSFDGITGVERAVTTPSGPHGGRVQNLDFPAPPGTPASDSGQERLRKPTSPLEEPSLWPRSKDKDVASSMDHDEATQALAQPDMPRRSGRPLTQCENRLRSPQAVPRHDKRSKIDTGSSFSPPLLMAPPRTRRAEMRYQAGLALHRASTALSGRWSFFKFSARLSIFFVKLGTLARPCWPMSASLQVSIPLVIVAAFDLGLPSIAADFRQEWPESGGQGLFRYDVSRSSAEHWSSLVLLAFHFAVLWLAHRWSALCVTIPANGWLS